MAGLAQKLGIQPGFTICMLDATVGAADLLRRESPAGVIFTDALDDEQFDMIVFWPKQLDGLAERFAELAHRIVPNGVIWAVIPKKQFAPRYGIAFHWTDMQAAGLATDLVDNKIASLSPEEYATRFVIRKDRRASYA
jgi:hypothetical protein